MNTEPSSIPPDRTRLWLTVVIAVILAGWALHVTASFMVPIVFSIFLALLVAPLDGWVAERVPEKVSWLGHVAAMGAILIALLVFVGLISMAAQQVIERFPFSNGDAGSLLPQFGSGTDPQDGAADVAAGAGATATEGGLPDLGSGEAASASGEASARFREVFSGALESLVSRLGEWASGTAMQILGAAGTALGAAVLVFFLTLIMLIEAPTWRNKVENVLAASASRKATDSTAIIADRLRRYLLTRTLLGVVTAALYAGWLWLFGIDLLVVWALLAVLLNFIPTFGSLVAGTLPVIYAFVQKDLGTTLAVGAGIFVIEQVMGNYVDPRVQGTTGVALVARDPDRASRLGLGLGHRGGNPRRADHDGRDDHLRTCSAPATVCADAEQLDRHGRSRSPGKLFRQLAKT